MSACDAEDDVAECLGMLELPLVGVSVVHKTLLACVYKAPTVMDDDDDEDDGAGAFAPGEAS